jgi:signal transduction histidine kinase/DNA-binding response OmpR family regulator
MESSRRLSEKDAATDFLLGGGEMGERMRSRDWSPTPLGSAENWPSSLKTSLSIMLASRFAMVVAWGPEFRFFYNDRYRPVLGSTKHPGALGTPAAEIFPEAWPFIGPLFESTRRGEAVALDDMLIPLDRNGYLENCYFTLSYSPIRDESGGVGGMLAVVAETTERLEGERRLATLRELARRAAEVQTPQQAREGAVATLSGNAIDVPFSLLYTVDEDGSQARLSACSGMSGGEEASPLVMDLSGHASWPISDVIANRKALVLQNLGNRFGRLPGGPYPEATHTAVIVPLVRPGQSQPDGILIFGVSPRRAFDDSYRGFFELAADHILTAIRNALAYQEERKRAESLAELDRAKTAFFSNVSHEFRTPLTLMVGPLEELLDQPRESVSEEVREHAELAHRNSLRLLKLVNTLLDFSRIEAGRVEAVYEPVDLAAYSSELASVFRSAMEKAGLTFIVGCAPLEEPVYVDREMWEKVVFNLLSNAFKFTFDGEVEVGLRRASGDNVEFFVRDTGTGIPPEEIPHLFKRFHRVKQARGRSYEGTGIGLAFIQELVRLHGGSVAVSSELNHGSTFSVRLPLGSAHLPPERIGAPRTQVSTGLRGDAYLEEALRWLPGNSGTRSEQQAAEGASRVLVADDNADMRDYVAKLLSQKFRVECVADGLAALEAARRKRPDLILSDIMMTGLDGFGLLHEIRSDADLRTIPVILLSARAGEEARVEGITAGADDYLVKPFGARELMARVESHLEMTNIRRRADAALREEREILETVNRSGQMLAAELDLQKLVQALTDAATEISGAQFGAFFYNVMDERGASYLLYSLSGVSREKFANFPMPRSTDLFGATFRGEGSVRIADVKHDPRYGRNIPYQGMPKGHVPVTSYLAVPVISRSGEVLGGLFFGHAAAGVFTERHERIVEGLAGQAAIAIDNARLYESAKKARKDAETANRLKDDFLATVSHELRTPLNAILGWARLLRSGRLDENKKEQAMEIVERNALAQQQIIEDILDVSRIITGKLRLEAGPVELSAVVEAAVDSIRPSADAKGVRLHLLIDSGTNPVLGDASRIQQIVWNLLSNAVKFTPRGGRIQVAVERHDSHVKINVRDTGQGISREFLPYVFERFLQADASSARQYGGLGLGLAIVRHLTELHGGTVSASSAGEGRGATFTVTLPLAAVHETESSLKSDLQLHHEPDAQASTLQNLSLRGIRVLAIDDEADARGLLSVILTQSDAKVMAVASVQEALGAMGSWKPDVIISDIGLPYEDGYALIRQLRALPPEKGGDLPAIALTAFARSEDRVKALAAGYQTHVTKPVDPAELVAVVASLTGRTGRACPA